MLVVTMKNLGFRRLTVILAVSLFSGFISDLAYGQVVLVKGSNPPARTDSPRPKPKAKSPVVRTRGINLGATDKPQPQSRSQRQKSGPAAAQAQGGTRGIDIGVGTSLLPKQMQFPVASPINNAKTGVPAAKTGAPAAPTVAVAPAAKSSPKPAAAPGTFTISMPKMDSAGSATAPATAAPPKEPEKKNNAVETVAVKEAAAKPAASAPATSPAAAPPTPAPAPTPVAPTPVRIAGPVLPPPKLSNFGFAVITADDRGRIVGNRVETGRYFQTELPGDMLLDMVQIPGGGYMMGSLESDLLDVKKSSARAMEKDLTNDIVESLIRRFNWETPKHMVSVPAFYMSKYEITQAQWRAVASLPKINTDLLSDPSSFKGSNLPVETITWEEAIEFCERLSLATGRRFRLPTEAEWEYACRAGTNTPFNFGDSIRSEWANFQGKFPYSTSPKGEFRETTVAVGTIGGPNAFGLYDMHGNVWEWCSDIWNESYDGAPTDGKSWDTGKIAYLRIIRGGAWDSLGGECRSNSRNRMTATIRLNSIGLRIVADIPDQAAPVQASLSAQ
jgi:formylglycine-generating enzyme required for sulfatase activity